MSIQAKAIAFSCYAVTEMTRSRAFQEGVLDPDKNVVCIHKRHAGHN